MNKFQRRRISGKVTIKKKDVACVTKILSLPVTKGIFLSESWENQGLGSIKFVVWLLLLPLDQRHNDQRLISHCPQICKNTIALIV